MAERIHQLSTHELSRAMSTGDADSVDLFYRQYFSWMYNHARKVTRRDESFCLDVVQDAVLRVIRTVKPVDCEARFLGWLRLVVQTTAFDLLRREVRRKNREAMSGRQYEEAAADSLQLDWLRDQIQQFDPQLIDIIELKFTQDWTLKQIGQRLGLSIGAVDGRLRRALKNLKLAAEMPEPPDLVAPLDVATPVAEPTSQTFVQPLAQTFSATLSEGFSPTFSPEVIEPIASPMPDALEASIVDPVQEPSAEVFDMSQGETVPVESDFTAVADEPEPQPFLDSQSLVSAEIRPELDSDILTNTSAALETSPWVEALANDHTPAETLVETTHISESTESAIAAVIAADQPAAELSGVPSAEPSVMQDPIEPISPVAVAEPLPIASSTNLTESDSSLPVEFAAVPVPSEPMSLDGVIDQLELLQHDVAEATASLEAVDLSTPFSPATQFSSVPFASESIAEREIELPRDAGDAESSVESSVAVDVLATEVLAPAARAVQRRSTERALYEPVIPDSVEVEPAFIDSDRKQEAAVLLKEIEMPLPVAAIEAPELVGLDDEAGRHDDSL